MVAREVVLELTLPESVRVESLSPFRVEQRRGSARVYLGDLRLGPGPLDRAAADLRLRRASGREVGAHRAGRRPRRRVRGGAAPPRSPATVAWTYADHAGQRRAAARPGGGPRRRPPVRGARQAGGRAAQPRGPLRRGPAASSASVRHRVGSYAGADRELERPARGARRGAGPLRGADAGDGPQGGATSSRATCPGCAPPRGSRARPDADPRPDVPRSPRGPGRSAPAGSFARPVAAVARDVDRQKSAATLDGTPAVPQDTIM